MEIFKNGRGRNDLMNNITLNNGISMPQLGLGVYKISDDEVIYVVSNAIETGYRSIDTAQFYNNERGVGEAIKRSRVDRADLFVTTKVWNSHHGFENTLHAFDESMEKLALDYIDLYLIHWPTPMFDNYVETYKALEKLYKDGRVRAIGVSNFHIEHIQRLLDECEIKPVVNQVECHPFLQQKELKSFCEKNDIYVESWSPLARGGVLNHEQIEKIAKKHGKTSAQVVLRWHIQENTIVIPKSVTPSRIKDNFQIFDFELTSEDMEQIAGLDCNKRTGREPNEMDIT